MFCIIQCTNLMNVVWFANGVIPIKNIWSFQHKTLHLSNQNDSDVRKYAIFSFNHKVFYHEKFYF